MMDLDLVIRYSNGEKSIKGLADGTNLDVCDSDMDMIFNQICGAMPVNHTVFKVFDSRKDQWTVEIYDGPRDFKTIPVWSGVFNRVID